ncbi:MAG: phosphotransferase [Chitinivibrionales bacterium]|nr:phosphotransferase [Chitinivibrionales bacterium]
MPRFSHQQLTGCLIRHLGSSAKQASLSPITTGKFNSSWFVELSADRYVLRIAPPRDSVFVFYERRMMKQEPAIHKLLREKTSVPVPEIIAFDETLQIIPNDFIIMSRLPGTPLSQSSGVKSERTMHQVGACLAQVHALTAETYGYIGDHHPMKPQPTWHDAFQEMWNRMIDDIVAVGYYSEQEADTLRTLLSTHDGLFDRPVQSSLLHMDIWAQNLLVENTGNLTGIVDWDRALWGDPEIEFAVLDYCGVSTPSFWKGYGRERDQSPEAQIRNAFYLLYEIQKYIVIRSGRNNDPQSARAHKRQVFDIVEKMR